MPNEVKLLPCEPTPEMASKFENCADANKIGDEVIYTTTRYRRWWQIWKPKSWADTNRYRVVEGFITSGLFDAMARENEWWQYIDTPASADTHPEGQDAEERLGS